MKVNQEKKYRWDWIARRILDEYRKYFGKMEHENSWARIAAAAKIQAQFDYDDDDHDCHASPDDGCDSPTHTKHDKAYICEDCGNHY